MWKYLWIIFILYSCGTTRDYLGNAQKYYSNGLWEKALTEIQLGLKRDPHNAELNIALEKTQEELYRKYLISVRDLREGGNVLESLNQMREVDKKFKQWNITSNINGFKFRKVELEKLFFELKRYLGNEIKKGYILKSYHELTSYSDLLNFLPVYNRFKKEIELAGQEKCQSMISKKDLYQFHQQFISDYCSFFQINFEGQNFFNELYNFDSHVLYIDNEKLYMNNFLPNRINHETGQKSLSAISNLKSYFKKNTDKIKKTSNYQVKEYYNDWETRTRWINQPYFVNEMVCDYINKFNPCPMKRVKKFRMVPQYYKVKVRKSRYKNKTYRYTEKHINQKLTLKGQSDIYVGKKKISIPILITKKHLSIKRTSNFPKANVYPRNDQLKDFNIWKKEILKDIESKLSQEVIKLWENQFCRDVSNSIKKAEYASRCQLVTKSSVSLNKWATDNFGLLYEDLSKILNKQ